MTKTFKLSPKLIEKLSSYGLTNGSICNILEMSEDEFNGLLNETEYLKAFKRGKDRADLNVIEQLYQKAIGYQHEDTHFASYQGEILSQTYIKHYPPDLSSIIFWLKNRRPQEWKEKIVLANNVSEEQMAVMRQIAYERMCENL